VPYRGSLGEIFWPDSYQLLLAPLDHDRYRKRVKAGLIELNCATRHRFGPTAFKARTMKGFGHCFRLCRLCFLYRLDKQVESPRPLDRLVPDEDADALGERVRHRGGEIVVCR